MAKILHIGIAYYPGIKYGGPVKSIHSLNHYLSLSGISSTVCVTNTDGVRSMKVPLKKIIDYENHKVIYFNSPFLHYYGYSISMLFWLIKNVKKYHCIHIHGVYSFPQFFSSVVCIFFKKPYILSPRGSLDERLARKKLFFLKKLYLIFFKGLFINAKYIHYTSPTELHNSLLKSKHSSFICPNIISITNHGKFTSNPNPHRILFINRISWKKRLDLLVLAFEALSKKYEKLELVIAGPDDEKLLKQEPLKKFVNQNPKIRYIGTKTESEITDLLVQGGIFVLPSEAENFSHSFAEALRYSIVCLVSKNVDLAQYKQIKSLVEFTELSTTSIKDAIDNILQNYEFYKKRMDESQSILNDFFDGRKIIEKMTHHYLNS